MKGQAEFAFAFGSVGLVCSKDPAGAQSVEFVFFGRQLFSLRFKENK